MSLLSAKIEAILKSREMKPIGLTFHAFLTDLYLWRKVRIEKKLRLPLPTCNRILPYVHSVWNNNKGGLDTTSKLMNSCPVQLASSGRAQTVTAARLLQLFCILQHQENHAARAIDNMETFVLLYHLRNANNKAFPLWKTYEALEDWFLNEADVFEAMITNGASYQTALSSPTTTLASSVARTATMDVENIPPTTPLCVQFDNLPDATVKM